MLDEYKNKINLGIGFGIILIISARTILSKTIVVLPDSVPIIMMFAGMIVFVWGCVNYAQAKGRHPLWGMLGMLSLLGLLALVFLPDKYKKQSNKSL